MVCMCECEYYCACDKVTLYTVALSVHKCTVTPPYFTVQVSPLEMHIHLILNDKIDCY